LDRHTVEKLSLVRPRPERIIFKWILEKLVKRMCHMNRNSSGSRLDDRDSILFMGNDFYLLHYIQIATIIHPACNKICTEAPTWEKAAGVWSLALFPLSRKSLWRDS
jgi:hypothetical protein